MKNSRDLGSYKPLVLYAPPPTKLCDMHDIPPLLAYTVNPGL